jgi:hypothetical protein
MDDTQYVFIVGLGRTGSTLTRQILNASDCIGIGGESHFLADLPRLGSKSSKSVRHQFAQIGDLSTDSGARKIVNHLFTIQDRHLNFWNFTARKVDREGFLLRLEASDHSDRSLFDLAMAEHAHGKPVRGDKTPAHIFHIPQLLEWFPNAVVIHTFRDPRAIYMSRKKKAEKETSRRRGLRRLGVVFELVSSMHVMINWLRVARCHEKYLRMYPERYLLSRYEDLVLNPEPSLKKMCSLIGIELTEPMLQQTVVNSSYLPDGAAGFDREAVERWRTHIDPIVHRWFNLWCKPWLNKFGYSV